MSRSRKKPRRIFNRTTIGFVFMLLVASGMLYRMLRPFWQAPPPTRSQPTDTAPVTADALLVPIIRVVDGDTIRVRYKGDDESVRLLRINTPERGRPGYREATNALKRLVKGGKVRLVFDEPGRERRDKYGRLLAYVEVNRVNANIEMVAGGWTRFWTKYGKGRFADEFREAEEQAKQHGRGLWTDQGWNR